MDEHAPWAKRRSEQRKKDAALPYDLEIEFRKVGWGDPALVYERRRSYSASETAGSPSPASTQTGNF